MASVGLSVYTALLVFSPLCTGSVTGSGEGAVFAADRGPPTVSDDIRLAKRIAIESELTEAEKAVFLAKHNELRSQTDPVASNMDYMTWNEDLAIHAQRWTDKCIWAHGFPEENNTPFSPVGQNLWVVGPVYAGFRPDGSVIAQSWYNEKQHYNYTTNRCATDEMCGHYTQLVWSSSLALGCGFTFCPTVVGNDEQNVVIAACHYGYAGNYAGVRPYTTGTPCTNCQSGIGHCYENMCRPCSDHNEECVCAAVCTTCSVMDTQLCKCNCRYGYYGADCSKKCFDKNEHCGNGIPYSWCVERSIRELCPDTCDVCDRYFEGLKCEE